MTGDGIGDGALVASMACGEALETVSGTADGAPPPPHAPSTMAIPQAPARIPIRRTMRLAVNRRIVRISIDEFTDVVTDLIGVPNITVRAYG